MPKKMSQDEVIEKFKLVHGDKYDYSKVVYTSSKEKVAIVCAIHGEFSMAPHNHIIGQGCRTCGYIVNSQKRSLGLEEFLKRSKEVHGDKYDYSKVDYTSSGEKVLIGCKTHGFFEQIAAHHMNGHGCNACWHDVNPTLQKMTTEEFVEKAKLVHGDKYDYSNTVYAGNDQQVLIGCKVHGEYSQRANDHLSKKAGCPACARVKKLTTDEFIKRSNKIHGIGKFDYSEVVYKQYESLVTITCSNGHTFKQTPHSHLNGFGCERCAGLVRKTTEEFIAESKELFGDKFTYDKVDYYNSKTPITLTCDVHGDFEAVPINHLMSSFGCPECAVGGYKMQETGYFYIYTSDEFIGFGISNDVKDRHNDHKYSFKKHAVVAELLKTYEMTGQQAWDLEREVKAKFDIINTGIDGFKTEAIQTKDLIKLLDYVENFINKLP